MNVNEMLKHVDHTLLTQTATWEEIKQICDDAVKYETASVCIPPSYVKQANEYMQGKIPVCTVIGFPNGYMTTKTKEFETKDAIANGASEIDMVINIGWLKDKKYDLVEDGHFQTIHITLKYGADKNEKVITGLKRISKPGLRVYANTEDIPRVLGGLGTAIISTNKGVVTDKEARKLGVGGEVLCFVW